MLVTVEKWNKYFGDICKSDILRKNRGLAPGRGTWIPRKKGTYNMMLAFTPSDIIDIMDAMIAKDRKSNNTSAYIDNWKEIKRRAENMTKEEIVNGKSNKNIKDKKS